MYLSLSVCSRHRQFGQLESFFKLRGFNVSISFSTRWGTQVPRGYPVLRTPWHPVGTACGHSPALEATNERLHRGARAALGEALREGLDPGLSPRALEDPIRGVGCRVMPDVFHFSFAQDSLRNTSRVHSKQLKIVLKERRCAFSSRFWIYVFGNCRSCPRMKIWMYRMSSSEISSFVKGAPNSFPFGQTSNFSFSLFQLFFQFVFFRFLFDKDCWREGCQAVSGARFLSKSGS